MTIRWWRALLVVLVAASVANGAARAEARRALVIGNQGYVSVEPLGKARADAQAVAAALASAGFEAETHADLTRPAMERVLDGFVATLRPGDEAVFYFAGHGVGRDGRNYLLGIDVPAPGGPGPQGHVRAHAVTLETVLGRLHDAGVRVAVAFIDACRDDPYRASTGASLERAALPDDSFVVFSASPGEVAYDRLHAGDDHPNSVFTRTLVELIASPVGEDIRAMTVELRRRVAAEARDEGLRQRPAYQDALIGRFGFRPDAAVDAPLPAVYRGGGWTEPRAAGWLNPSQVALLQTRLRRMGYDAGPVDGVLGSRTRRAIAHWQADHGYGVTGRLTRLQLNHLLGTLDGAFVDEPWGGERVLPRPLMPVRERPRLGVFDDGNFAGRYVDERGCARERDGRTIFCPAHRY